MGLPASGAFDVGTITDNDDFAGKQEAFRAFVETMLGGADLEALTETSDAVTPTTGICSVAGEAAADDDLKNVLQTNLAAGQTLLLRSAGTEVITCKHMAGGAGQLHFLDSLDVVLDDAGTWILFLRNGTRWDEVLSSRRNRVTKIKNVTAGVGSPEALSPSDSGRILENTGAGAATYADLPAATAGLRFFLYTAAAQTWNLNPDGADTFRDLATTGTTFSLAAVVGNYVEVVCILAGEWVVVRKQGVLTVA